MARRALVLSLLLLAPASLAAQADSTAPGGVRFRLPGTLPALRFSPFHQLARTAFHPDAAKVADAWREEVERALEAGREAQADAAILRALYGRQEGAEPGENRLLALGRRYTDLALDGSAGMEFRTDRYKNHRCTAYQLQDPGSGCQGHFTAPRLDSEFLIRAGGVVGRRLNIAVDYDSKRDFEANNDIRVFYQGLEDEIVQRVEFGTVTFTPPPSRFITAAVPAYSFGINTKFEFGPVTLGAVAASQKGSAVTERTYTVGATTSQPQDRALRDLDFEQGRFFWVVDPALVPSYPAVDILDLAPSAVPLAERPTEVRVYRHRPTRPGGVNPTLGGITAFGYRPDDPVRTGAVQWELLVDGKDYVLDGSKLWVALANRLDAGDFLAVSYRTAADGSVGTFPAVDQPAANDSLLLVAVPHQGRELPTFRHEMRQVYRVAGTDLDRASLKVDLTLNRSESPVQGATTYLAQLGLAASSDQNVFNAANRLYPRTRDLQASAVLREAYIIFPNLEPFADPVALTPPERIDSLYRTPLYLLYTQGPSSRFQFRLQYNAAGGQDRSRLELNAFQIREGSERVSVNGRVLERGVDYSIAYDLGQVTFLDPEGLFGDRQATVSARFEERGIFAVAPTTIYGLTSTYRIGETGSLNFIGIYQQENTTFNRPPVGFEPTANLVGGVTGEFHFKPGWATRAMNALVAGGTKAPSRLDLNGEFAFTAPQLNRAGAAYLEEFEGEGGLQVSLRENAWGFGSIPQSASGIGFLVSFDSSDAVQLTWQNLVPSGGRAAQFRTSDIDSLVRITGGANPVETVLYFTLQADTVGGFTRSDSRLRWVLPRRDFRPRWRSVVTSLSPTGTDLSQSEFLEFWVYELDSHSADVAKTRLVLDLGSVGEDALALAPESLTVTGSDSIWTGRRYAGVGRLDTEREQTGIFNAQTDDNGILVDRPDSLIVNGVPTQDLPTCGQELSGVVLLYPWGDPNVRCTRGNGTLDAEDLDGDNVLNANGAADNVRRYVVDLSDTKYFIRNGVGNWRLFRVPLRQPDDSIGAPNMRLVRHLRITVAAPGDSAGADLTGRFALARFRFLGSPWVRRSDAPVLGLSGATAEPHGEVVVTTISTDNKEELGYEPPPGVLDEAAQQGSGRGLQINERSLRVIGRDLRPGERAEGYFRFIAGAQNLLKYRTLKLWVRGRGPGWNDGRLQAVFKAASDDRNFYLYRTNALDDTWLPEVSVDLEVWRRLRAQVETRWLQGEAPSGAAGCGVGDSTAYVACDGNYLVQVGDPGINPPNLAAVQEIDAAVYYAGAGTSLDEAELWVDDVRLLDPVNVVGTASALSARLAAADVADLSVGYTRQDGDFHQIGQDPTFRTTSTAVIATSVRVDRFLPAKLGLSIPATVSYTRSAVDPLLVTGTDLRAADLPGLRRPSASQWAWGVSLRRSRRGADRFTRTFVDPVGLNGAWSLGRNTSELSAGRSSAYSLGLTYNIAVPRRGPTLPLDGVVRSLPRWLRESPVGEGMSVSRLALLPTSVRFTSGLARSEASRTSFRVPVERPDDSLRVASLNLSHVWRNSAGVTWQPLGMLTLDGDLSSTRDLRRYADSTPLGRLAGQERRQFLGMDVGVERDRQLTTTMGLVPLISRWLRPRYSRTSTFSLTRDLTNRSPVRATEDSGAFLLPQSYSNQQSHELGGSVDLNRVAALVAGDSSRTARALRRLRPLDLSVQRTRTASFDLATFDPDLGFMLALGDLDAFLVHDGQQAIGVSEVEERKVSGGAELPGGLSLSMSYSDLLTQTYSPGGEETGQTESRQQEWPQGSLRWNQVLSRGPVALIGLGTTMRRREGSTTTLSESGAARARTTQTVLNPDALVSLRGGLSLSLAYNRTGSVSATGTNRTEQVTGQWSGSASHSLRLPASISVARRPLRVSVNGQTTTSQTCLFLGASPERGCRTVADIRRLALAGGFTTDVLPMATAGLNFQYVSNDIRHVNQKTTQLSIVASLRVQLSTGDLR